MDPTTLGYRCLIFGLVVFSFHFTAAGAVSPLPPHEDYPGHVLTFDGTHSNAKSVVGFEVPSPDEPLTQFSVSAWVRVRQHKQHNMLLVSTDQSAGFAVFVDSGEKACLGLFRPGGMKTVSSRSLQLPFAWHHIVATYDGNQSLIYVDGMPGDPDPVPGIVFKELSFTAGGLSSLPQFRHEGSIARIQLWDHARSAAQVAHDMLADWTRPQDHLSGLLGSWPLSKGSGLVMADKSSNGRSGYVKGDLANLPIWDRSTIPHFAAGQLQAELNLGVLAEGGYLEVVSLPAGGKLRLKDKFSGKEIGGLPRVPWPLVDKRRLVFVPEEGVLRDAVAAGKPVCSSLVLRFSKDNVTTSHLVELLVGTTKEHLGLHELNKGCRQSRAFHGVVSRHSSTVPVATTVSFLAPISSEGYPGDWLPALESAVQQGGAGGRGLSWELVVTYPKGFDIAVALEGLEERVPVHGRLQTFEMPQMMNDTAQLANQAAALARGRWLMPLSPRLRLSPSFLIDVAEALRGRASPEPSAIAPEAVTGDPGVPMICPEGGVVPEEEEQDAPRSGARVASAGAAAACGCGGGGGAGALSGAPSEALAKAAAAALGMEERWELLLPGGLVPARTWRLAGGWDSAVPLGLHHWDFWLKLLQPATAPPLDVLRVGEVSNGDVQPGQCSWAAADLGGLGGDTDALALDSAVALLRAKHRGAFGEETLQEADAAVELLETEGGASMGPRADVSEVCVAPLPGKGALGSDLRGNADSLSAAAAAPPGLGGGSNATAAEGCGGTVKASSAAAARSQA